MSEYTKNSKVIFSLRAGYEFDQRCDAKTFEELGIDPRASKSEITDKVDNAFKEWLYGVLDCGYWVETEDNKKDCEE